MKILKNTSGYDTRAIRALIVLAHHRIRSFENEDAPRWRDLRVSIRGRKRSHTSGCAQLGGWRMWLTLPREGLTARRLLWLAYHELMHSYGYMHRQYKNLTDAELAELVPNDFDVPKAAPAKKPDAKVTRIETLLKRRAAWQSKLRRAQTALQKINRSVRYYERKQPLLLAAVSEKRPASQGKS